MLASAPFETTQTGTLPPLRATGQRYHRKFKHIGDIVQRHQKNAQRLLDTDMTLERLAGDETLLEVAARTFAQTAPQLVASISTALASNDLNRAFKHAQSLKGAVATFEAPQVLNSVLNIERHTLNEDAAAAANALPTAIALVERLVAEVAVLVPSVRFESRA